MASRSSQRRSPGLYIGLVLLFVVCMWAGWRDFDPWVPQEQVRQEIRSTIRGVIQILVQFVVPGAIVLFFGREAYDRLRGKRESGTQA